MIEPKVSLSLLVRSAGMLNESECEKNPKENYEQHRLTVNYTKGKGQNKKRVQEVLVFHTRKPRLITQHINIGKEAYESMLSTPVSEAYTKILKNKKGKIKRVWDTLPLEVKLKEHFKLIAEDLGAVSFSFEILDD